MERIAKVIARAGVCSRREAEKLILMGRVRVKKEIIESPAFNVEPGTEIYIDDEPLPVPENSRLFRFYKPLGVLTAVADQQNRKTLQDFLDQQQGLPRLMPVGRLDINSEGLLLLTNDGGLKRRLELPSTGWLRRYRVRAYGNIEEKDLEGLKKGITVDGEKFGSILARLDSRSGANAWYSVGLKEGKNREIRKVFEHFGLKVSRLIRVAYGPFQLGKLEAGQIDEIYQKVLKEQLGAAYLENLNKEAGLKPSRKRPAR